VFVDRRCQLAVIDPDGREMLISVGAAVFNLRVAVRAHGRVNRTGYLPIRASRTWPREFRLAPIRHETQRRSPTVRQHGNPQVQQCRADADEQLPTPWVNHS
jgi:hypothetical protein